MVFVGSNAAAPELVFADVSVTALLAFVGSSVSVLIRTDFLALCSRALYFLALRQNALLLAGAHRVLDALVVGARAADAVHFSHSCEYCQLLGVAVLQKHRLDGEHRHAARVPYLWHERPSVWCSSQVRSYALFLGVLVFESAYGICAYALEPDCHLSVRIENRELQFEKQNARFEIVVLARLYENGFDFCGLVSCFDALLFVSCYYLQAQHSWIEGVVRLPFFVCHSYEPRL